MLEYLLTSNKAGMVVAGLGAGLNELIALAGTSELVPVRKRATYVGGVVFTILPFCPSPLWAQLITKSSNWRYNGYLVGGWNFIGLVLVMCFYKEPSRTKRSAKEILGEVDFIGGLLSTAGVVLFMMGMQWGSREVCLSCNLAALYVTIELTVEQVLMGKHGGSRHVSARLCFNRCLLRVRNQICKVAYGSAPHFLSGQADDDIHLAYYFLQWG